MYGSRKECAEPVRSKNELCGDMYAEALIESGSPPIGMSTRKKCTPELHNLPKRCRFRTVASPGCLLVVAGKEADESHLYTELRRWRDHSSVIIFWAQSPFTTGSWTSLLSRVRRHTTSAVRQCYRTPSRKNVAI